MSALDRQLEAARGWLLLGAPEEAARELDGIEVAHQFDPPMLVVRAAVFQALGQWEQLRTVALLLRDAQPMEAQWWLLLALATRELHGLEWAADILQEAIARFPEAAGAYYDLARCEARLGQVESARRRLEEAVRLDPGFRKSAQVDPDLTALWTEPPGGQG